MSQLMIAAKSGICAICKKKEMSTKMSILWDTADDFERNWCFQSHQRFFFNINYQYMWLAWYALVVPPAMLGKNCGFFTHEKKYETTPNYCN